MDLINDNVAMLAKRYSTSISDLRELRTFFFLVQSYPKHANIEVHNHMKMLQSMQEASDQQQIQIFDSMPLSPQMVTAQNKELPCESELQQVESTAMQDLSRAAATALCRGNSVSSPADAAAADLHRSQTADMSACAESHSGPIARESAGYLRRIRADRAAEVEAREGSGAPRTRPVRGAERTADLTAAAAAAAVRDNDAISLFP
jgi:hypothetical protein